MAKANGLELSVEIQEKRAATLISQMTLEEKVSQMVYDAPAIERLNIPAYNWWNEGLHGLGRAGIATVFPQAIGLGATWNADLLYRVATVISDEARAKHHEATRLGMRGIYAGLTIWSPNINLFRDPRWGRGQETYSEDPYHTAELGVAFVKGLQGDDPEHLKVVATPKHFAVHSGPEPDRHHFDAQVSQQEMWDYYLYAFEACVKVGKAASIMGAYNRVNGEAACASPTLLQKILRDTWGFDGYVVSDCGAILDIYAHHKIVDTPEEAAALAVKNGCELNCGEVYPALIGAVEQGLITEEEIDNALEKLLDARLKLGMFDQSPYDNIPYEIIHSEAHSQLALEAARESIVLLKNEGDLLPLRKDVSSIAVIGPNADDIYALLGNYNGTPAEASTPLEAIIARVSAETKVYTAIGCEIAEEVPPLTAIPSNYLRTVKGGNVQGLQATYYTSDAKVAFTRVDESVNFIWKDTSPINGVWGEHFSATWEGYLIPPVDGIYNLGVNGYTDYELTLDGETLVQSNMIHHPIRQVTAVELVGGQSYALKLTCKNEGLDPQVQLLWAPPEPNRKEQAIEAAKQAEVVIMVMGISAYLEGEEMPYYPDINGFNGGDRTSIDLPKPQQDLLEEIHALGKPMVLVLMTGSATAINWADDHIPAIVQAWYPGQAGGEAIADVLFGDYNPGGKLPVTFYKDLNDLPDFTDYGLDGHTYRYFDGDVLYPFGFGLSYTSFAIEELTLSQDSVSIGNSVDIHVTVKNTGDLIGDEVVQLYIRREGMLADKILLGFRRMTLAPNEMISITFTLHSSQLGIHNIDADYIVAPGEVEVLVGNSSANLPLKATFTLTGKAQEMSNERVFLTPTT